MLEEQLSIVREENSALRSKSSSPRGSNNLVRCPESAQILVESQSGESDMLVRGDFKESVENFVACNESHEISTTSSGGEEKAFVSTKGPKLPLSVIWSLISRSSFQINGEVDVLQLAIALQSLLAFMR